MGCTITHIFDNIQNIDEEVVAQQAIKIEGKREGRKIETYGFTTLMYAIANDRPDIAKHVLRELGCRTLQAYDCDGKRIAPGSTAAQMAVYLERSEIVRLILEYLRDHKNTELRQQLAEPNEDGFSFFHAFIQIKNPTIQNMLRQYDFTPSRTEYQNEQHPIVLACIQNTCPQVLEYILALCRTYIYKEPTRDICRKKAQIMFKTLNGMLEDTSVDQQNLAKCRILITDFMYDKLPSIMQQSNAPQTTTFPRSPSPETNTEKEIPIDQFVLKSSHCKPNWSPAKKKVNSQPRLDENFICESALQKQECYEKTKQQIDNMNAIRAQLGVTPINVSSESNFQQNNAVQEQEISTCTRVTTCLGELQVLEEESQ